MSDRYNHWECRKCISISSVIFYPNENEKEEVEKYLQNIPVDSGANKKYDEGERKVIQTLQNIFRINIFFLIYWKKNKKRRSEKMEKGWSSKAIWGLVCGIVSLFLFPIILGPIGIVLGIQSKNEGDPHGETVWIVSLICMIVGMIAGIITVGMMSGGY